MKRMWIIGMVLVVVLAGGAYFVFQDRGLIAGLPGKDPAPSSPTTPIAPPGDLDPSPSPMLDIEASQVAEAITKTIEHPMDSVVDELKKNLDPKVALPPGAKLVPLQETWASDGVGGGTMNTILRMPGEPDEYYLVVMVQEDDVWKVLQTFYQKVES